MGKALQGPLGPVSGKVGPAEFYIMNGKTYIRSRKKTKKKKIRTPDQRAQNNKMTLLSPFLNSATDFFKVGFKEKTKIDDVFNTAATAKSVNLLNAIKGDKPARDKELGINVSKKLHLSNVVKGGVSNWEIDWENIVVSRGSLLMPFEVNVVAVENGFEFNWGSKNSTTKGAKDNRTMLLAYCAANDKYERCTISICGERRETRKDFLEIDNKYKGKAFQVFLAFMDATSEQVSDSHYCGELVFK